MRERKIRRAWRWDGLIIAEESVYLRCETICLGVIYRTDRERCCEASTTVSIIRGGDWSGRVS